MKWINIKNQEPPLHEIILIRIKFRNKKIITTAIKNFDGKNFDWYLAFPIFILEHNDYYIHSHLFNNFSDFYQLGFYKKIIAPNILIDYWMHIPPIENHVP
jgi:hypothetical protein